MVWLAVTLGSVLAGALQTVTGQGLQGYNQALDILVRHLGASHES